MNKIEIFFQTSTSSSEYSRNYFSYLSELIKKLDYEEIAKVIDLFLEARQSGKMIFFIGNGGSAATASHFANDIGIGTRSKFAPFRSMSLTDNNAVMTAITNDYGYEQVFVKQLETLFSKGDLLVAISASGNSSNLLNAVKFVHNRNGTTIGLTGFDGSMLKKTVDYSIHVTTDDGEYGPVEDIQMIFDHIIGTYLMYSCKKEV